MPTISDFSYGFSSSGVDAYLEDIKSNALQNAKVVRSLKFSI